MDTASFFQLIPGTPITLPLLGLEINPPIGFTLGPLSVHFYGVIIAVGLILAVVYALRRKEQFGLTEDDLLDGVLAIVPFAVICARAYYCIFAWEEFKDDPLSVLYIWNGGLAIYGGVIGAIVGIILLAKVKKKNVFAIFDLTSLGFLIGQSIGRWGNFMNREAYGGETTLPWRMGLQLRGETVYVHPTFLYESLWNLAGFLLLHFLSKKRKYNGQIALGYVAWYGLGRAVIEGLRTDSLMLGSLRISQLLAAVSCMTAVTILIIHAVRGTETIKK